MEKLRFTELDWPTATKQANTTESIDAQNLAARKQDALIKFGEGAQDKVCFWYVAMYK